MSITAGGHVQNTSSSIGVDVGGGLGNGEVTVSGPASLWTNSGDVNVGYGGEGTLDVSNDGQVEIDGQLLVGGAGKGTLNITMGGYVLSHGGSAGVGVAGIQSDITVAGTGSTWKNSGELRVGDAGTSSLQITSGGVVQNTNGWVGASDVGFEGTGEVTVSGPSSLWTNSGDLTLGAIGGGTVNVSAGGSVEINGELVAGSTRQQHVNITAGGQVYSVGTPDWPISAASPASLYLAPAPHWTIDGQFSIGGLIDGSGNAGIGTVRVQSGVTVSVGSFTILFADDLLSLEGGTFSTTDLSFRGGGTFGWTSGTLHVGKYRGSLTVPSGGVLAPGNSVGQTTVDVNYSQSAGAILEIEIASAASADFVNVTGFADLGGNLQLKLLGGFLPSQTSSFTIFDSRGITGSFANVANGLRLATADGLGSFVVHYGAGSTFDPTQIVLSNFLVAAIPGDYNQNGIVDAADYTVWRNNLGSGTSLPNDDTPGVGQDDYTRWKTHFGQTAGSGSGAMRVPPSLSRSP